MKIEVKTTIHSSLDTCWKCFTEPEHIIHWNFASDDWHCPAAINELKPNGEFVWRMEAKDGSMAFDYKGTYSDIIPKERILMTLADGRNVTVAFHLDGDMVELTETFDADKEHLDLQKRGWQAILDNFKKYVESIT